MTKNIGIVKKLNKYLSGLKNIVFPPICFCCKKNLTSGYVCSICQDNIHYMQPIYQKNLKNKEFYYNNLIAATSYKEPMTTLIRLFKYSNYDYLADYLASLIIKQIAYVKPILSEYDLITSVPLHPKKLRKRGYNQSSLLAKRLANYLNIPFKDGIIYARKNKPSQTKLNISERKKNIEGAFGTKTNLMNKKIILVDDVFTTGTTLNQCAAAMRKHGADKILALVLARTL